METCYIIHSGWSKLKHFFFSNSKSKTDHLKVNYQHHLPFTENSILQNNVQKLWEVETILDPVSKERKKHHKKIFMLVKNIRRQIKYKDNKDNLLKPESKNHN